MTENTTKPVLAWLGQPGFYWIHVSAVISCSLSIIFSSSVLLYSYWVRHRDKVTFWKSCIGERIVFYLVVCDLGFSTSHGSDHAIILFYKKHPDAPWCTIYAFIVQTFMCAQSLVVNMAAVVAVIMLVRERKIGFGRYDWRLITYAFGIPLVIGTVNAPLGNIGPSKAWCIANESTPGGRLLNMMYGVLFVSIFVVNTVLYTVVACKLRHVTGAVEQFSNKDVKQTTLRSIRTMLLFVIVYIVQWWAYAVHALWNLIKDQPPLWIYVAVVTLCNCGGVFNAIAYTIIRRRKRNSTKSVFYQSSSNSYCTGQAISTVGRLSPNGKTFSLPSGRKLSLDTITNMSAASSRKASLESHEGTANHLQTLLERNEHSPVTLSQETVELHTICKSTTC